MKCYHAYKDLRKPFINKELTTAMEPDNVVDKYTSYAKKNDVIVGHQPHCKNGRFAKMIITGKEVNLGDGEGMPVPCLLVVEDFWSKTYVTYIL